MKTHSSIDPELQLQRDELADAGNFFLLIAWCGLALMVLIAFIKDLFTGEFFRRHGRRLAPAQARFLGPVTEHHGPSRPTPFTAPSVPAEVFGNTKSQIPNTITK
ncbi:MAG: hypothetical protein HOP33_19180 [Verrucomicrobia bacterium]|nr:hypothetical protein [Verrucomicrobiota bacterium]